MKIRVSLFLITITMVAALTGCYDNIDINNREYIFAVGIDENPDGTDPPLSFTAEIPKINTGSKDERIIFTEKSQNFTDFYYKSFIRTDKAMSDRLMQIIIIGEDVASNPDYIKSIFDEIERSPQINRRVRIAIAKGTAEDIINTDIPNNPIVGRYLSELLVKLKKENYQSIYTFDEALLLLHNFGNGMIPLVEKYDGGLKVDGSAVMKGHSLMGYLNFRENEIIMLLTNPQASNINGMTIEVDDIPVTLGGEDITITKKINLNDDKLTAEYYVTLFCYIDSFKIGDKNLSEPEYLDKIENIAVEKISEDTNKIIDKMQNTYRIDLLRIQEQLAKFQKIKYDKIKNNYEEVFCNADIKVHYNVVIKSTGLVK